MYGRRSTGKTWTLNRIAAIFGERAKYIKQFELQNFGKDYTSEQFETDQKARLEGIVNSFFSPFKDTVEDIAQIPSSMSDDAEIDSYLKALIKRSEMENIKDVYSNSTLYDEIPYSVGGTRQLRSVINAVITLLESTQYQDIITAHVKTENLKSLLKVLIEKLHIIEFTIKCRNLSNDILNDVKSALQMQTALPAIPDIDFYELSKRQYKRERFGEIVHFIKQDRVIYQETMHRFRIKLRTRTFDNASDVKAGQGIGQSLVDAYSNYGNPLSYLKKLIDLGIDTSKLHKLFVGVQYEILNENGYKVSGGEQSEFTFLQKIKDARTKDILLIDEPESSFDNMFLKKDINNFLKGISEEMPVVISTHNNTIGGSISPDYILYTEKVIENGEAKYKRYSGYATDTTLKTVEGEEIENYQITIDSLEAGEEAYQERNTLYGILKNPG
jgi:ABC-type dipeptide/oligopeptide/nickel transport system ATPase subunit